MKPVLLISASDSSGAAGMAVDIRVADDIGHPVRCALTAVTVQGDEGLISSFTVSPESVTDAVTTANSDPAGIGAVKIGLITAPEVVHAVSTALVPLYQAGIPVVLDPVIRSTPGSILASRRVKEALISRLLPITTVVTPNRDELKELAVMAGKGDGDEEEKAEALLAMGTGSVLVTGGDDGDRTCLDILYRPNEQAHVFQHPRIGARATRGTGCSLSTAIAAHMGRGMDILEAIVASISYVTGRIEKAEPVGNQRLLFPGKEES